MRTLSSAQLLAILSLALLTGCAAFQPRIDAPHIAIVDFNIRELGVFQQRYTLTLNVQNPNNRAIPVSGMSYALQIAGDDFARGVSPQAFTLPAFGEARVEVDLTTNLMSTLNRLQALMEMDEDVVGYRLSGKLNIESGLLSGTLPFTNQGELKLTF